MMEKYGVDQSDLPVTKEQRETILKLYRELPEKILVRIPENKKEAQEMIESLIKES